MAHRYHVYCPYSRVNINVSLERLWQMTKFDCLFLTQYILKSHTESFHQDWCNMMRLWHHSYKEKCVRIGLHERRQFIALSEIRIPFVNQTCFWCLILYQLTLHVVQRYRSILGMACSNTSSVPKRASLKPIRFGFKRVNPAHQREIQ